ncbi:hypothetical protein AVEN_12877-1 [Araneus ventricosus]|uniref:Uncharacterized protein n=1 Tax=Araneus ventricosus TaxID=182803 RepID=A0A4Y1ZUB3_ARAVE|nr:hypothetical protein AVEN_12877-1 [Araneus ventricosus]
MIAIVTSGTVRMRRNGYKEPSDLWFGSFIHSADMDAFHVPLTCYKCVKEVGSGGIAVRTLLPFQMFGERQWARMECPCADAAMPLFCVHETDKVGRRAFPPVLWLHTSRKLPLSALRVCVF